MASSQVDGKDLVLKWTVGSTKVTFDLVAETTAYVAVGFSHANDTAMSKAEYDAFVGGVKDGRAYGASYTIEAGGDLKRENGNRYTVRHGESKLSEWNRQKPARNCTLSLSLIVIRSGFPPSSD